jgi:hypothetical protein
VGMPAGNRHHPANKQQQQMQLEHTRLAASCTHSQLCINPLHLDWLAEHAAAVAMPSCFLLLLENLTTPSWCGAGTAARYVTECSRLDSTAPARGYQDNQQFARDPGILLSKLCRSYHQHECRALTKCLVFPLPCSWLW